MAWDEFDTGRLSSAALPPLDEFPHLLTTFAADLAKELRASFAPDDLAALAADLTIEAGTVSLFRRLTALLAELTVALGAEGLFASLTAHAAGLPDRHVPSSLGHLS